MAIAETFVPVLCQTISNLKMLRLGAIRGVTRGCRYVTKSQRLSVNKSSSCLPDERKKDAVECKITCAERDCNLMSASMTFINFLVVI